MHSISTNTSLGRRETSTVALAGAVSGLKIDFINLGKIVHIF
ncbi:MAG: hypothetical protein RLZZ115_3379 [Cyanobacteriota bacterium]